MSRVFVGLDLGKKGGLVFLKDNKIIHKEKMPLVAEEDVDVKTVGKIIKKYGGDDCHVIFEKFSGFFGYSKMSAVSLARQSGFIEATLVLINVPYTKIQPQVWQKVVWEGTKMVLKTDGKKDTKKISLLTATRLFPTETFLMSTKSKKPHDGIIDAALLAVYGYRKGL